MIILTKKPVLLQVIYYLPDYPSLLQEFTWGYEDQVPELMKTHEFLNHWKNNIDAVISQALISINDSHHRKWRAVDEIINWN